MTPIYASDPVINAYQKALIYLNGSPTIQYARNGSRYIKVYKYISLKDLLVNGNLHQIGYYTLPTMDYTSCNVWHIATNEKRRLFVWEILGRICHLLADMSIPAHVRNELHPNGDRYELEVAGIQVLPNPQYQPPPYTLYTASTAYNAGGFINPYTNATDGNPIRFIFYTMNQIADFFPSNSSLGDDDLPNGSYPFINNYYNNLGSLPTGYNVYNVANGTMNTVIRLTAGLLYWFANECNLIPPPPTVAPIISNFAQSPKPIYQGSSGSVTCNLSQGNGAISYNWSVINDKPGVSVSFYGDRAEISYNSNALNFKQSENNNYNIEAPVGIELQCSVYNSVGSDVKRYIVDFATTPHGCPFVYTWNGETWVEDNNILPQSQDPDLLGQDVTDFYQLYTKPILDEGKYYLAIGEFEEEISYLDHLKLLVVDHPQETFITVDDEGEIIQFAKPAYFANAQLDSNDVYKKLVGLDSIKAEVSIDDTLSLSFEDVSIGTEKWLLLIGQQQPIYKDKIAGSVLGGGKENTTVFSSFRLRKNPTYQWVLVPDGNSSTLQVDIAFKSEAEIDYTELSHKLELPFTVYTPQLLYAEHSTYGDVTSLLNQTDEEYSVLNTDEMITLEYSAPPINEGMERSFIFVSRGKYERLENKMLAKGKTQIENKNQQTASTDKTNIVYEYGLSQNYPNPFNPVTTISYQIKEQGLVQLKVYNLLGQEIVTLVNEDQPSGIYEALFNASNLPSGVYIYSLRVNDFVQNQKMTLLK